MSTTIETPVPGAEPPATAAPDAASRKRPGIGAAPRVDLLPLALRVRQHQKRVRRGLRFGLVGVVAVMALATGGGVAFNSAAQASLAAAQNDTLSLLGQQAKYSDVKMAQQRIALIRAAQAVGAGTEVDWKAYLGALRATLPAGVTLTSITVDSASPMKGYVQPTAPLEGPRVATLTFTAHSPKLPDVPTWIYALGVLPAFVDAVPDSVTLDEGGGYVVNMTMHIGTGAYSHRFAPQEGGTK